MKTLNIKDLPVAEELDRRTMSAVRGGMSLFWPVADFSKTSMSFDTQQYIGQSQNTIANTGVNVAFAKDISANVSPKQEANNSNVTRIGAPLLA
jgi:hypothetical protein